MEEEGEKPLKRIRIWPHTDGVYAAHVSFSIKCNDAFVERVSTLIKSLSEEHSLTMVALDPSELHISLTRTYAIPKTLVSRFVRNCVACIESSVAKGDIYSFKTKVTSPVLLGSDGPGNSFLALCIDMCPVLEAAFDCMDECVKKMGLEATSSDWIPHVSVAWGPPNTPPIIINNMQSSQDEEIFVGVSECRVVAASTIHILQLPHKD